MRRISVWASLCLFLLGSALARVHAQQISIAGDINNPAMTMDISLRDADLNEVLTAMFNTTGGKYQLQVGNGVVGRIPRLQLIQTPFDKALDAILGIEYSYLRRQIGNGNYLYTINGRGTPNVPDTGATVPTMAPPSSSATSSSSAVSAAPSSPSSPSSSSTPPSLLTIKQKKEGGKPGDPASTETLVVNTIKVINLDVSNLCEALGGTAVKLFVSDKGGTGGGSGGTKSSGTNTNNNNNNNNMNNNNNGTNNNGYNNTNNNNNNNNNGYNSNSNSNSNNNNNRITTTSNNNMSTNGIR